MVEALSFAMVASRSFCSKIFRLVAMSVFSRLISVVVAPPTPLSKFIIFAYTSLVRLSGQFALVPVIQSKNAVSVAVIVVTDGHDISL